MISQESGNLRSVNFPWKSKMALNILLASGHLGNLFGLGRFRDSHAFNKGLASSFTEERAFAARFGMISL